LPMLVSASDAQFTLRRSSTLTILRLLTCLLATVCADAQKTSQSGAPPKPGKVTAAKPGEFFDKELDLHFNYPVEMQPVDAVAEMGKGHQTVYGDSGENDAEHQQAKRCVKFLIDAVLPQDKAPQRSADLGGMWAEQPKTPAKPEPIFAKILLVETARDCLPKELQENEGEALSTIALGFVSADGIQRMPKPIWYEIGKQKIHMNSGVGRPTANGQEFPTPIIVMSMATAWRGHLLAWVFTANDKDTFNEITKSMVQFGDAPWAPMFAGDIGSKGSGTPMNILPK